MPKVSIIIPTYLRHDKLRECLRSVVEYVAHENTECIVVANGASDETKIVFNEFAAVWGGEACMLWFDEPMGYPRSVNAGIRECTGEFIVLLNDDAEFLPQPRNQCIDVMLKPMVEDGGVGVTGPLMTFDENSGHEFLIFFCVMVRRACFDEVGLLDEGFRYFGEDTAFCIEAERKGWKVVRVPEDHPTELVPLDPATTSLETWKHDKVHSGMFRIWHDAESTIGRLGDCDEVLRESRARLKDLYGSPDDINIHRAMATDGWIAHDELQWLARQAKACGPNATIVQIGAWHGKSSRAISDNMCEGTKLFDVDTFNGSSGEPDQHATAKEREGDHCFQWYWDNQYEHILQGKVIPMRMLSANAAHTLNHRGIKADMIFIDGDHSAEGIKRDVEAWLPLLNQGGIICGHDYYKEHEGPHWVHVRQYVESKFPNVEKSATSIWHVHPHGPQPRGHVYDCFIFSAELDLLELRLATLNDAVDRFVIVEGTIYHNGEPKPLFFDDNKDRFAPYLHKITHVVVDDWPEATGNVYDNAWMRERWQRDAIMRGLQDCQPSDIIILGDADEIPNPETVAAYNVSMGLCRLKQRMFYYYLNCENKEGWDWQKMAPYSLVKQLSPCGIRYPPAGDTPLLENGGWHWSMLGGAEAVRHKLSTYSHQEFNRPEILEGVEAAMEEGRDIFGRDLKYEFVEIDETYPKYVQDRQTRLQVMGFIRYKSPFELAAEVKAEFPEMLAKFRLSTEKPETDSANFSANADVIGDALTLSSPLSLGKVELPTENIIYSQVVPYKPFSLGAKKPWTVTAEISTKDRYQTTLPLAMSAIVTQSRKPDKLVIYDDGEQADLREVSPFKGLFQMCDERGIKWEIFATPRKGQVTNHQHCLDQADTDFIFRCDDDVILMPDCLERLLNTVRDYGIGGDIDNIGAVAPLIHHPGNVSAPPDFLDGSLNDVQAGLNLQWFKFNGGPREVAHLYSSFLYSVSAARKAGGYPKTLSQIGHREETIFSVGIQRAGYKLLIDPRAVAYHLRENTGGIRSFTDHSLWDHDEQVFQSYLQEWGAFNSKPTKLIVLDCGIGDHFAFKSILPRLREIHADKELVLSVCFPSVFEGENLKLISIADAKQILGERYETDSHLYRALWERNSQLPLTEAMLEFWG